MAIRQKSPIPFHYQISEEDCFPTSVMNALIYLFNKPSEIPGEVIRMVYLLSLDDLRRGGDISSKEGAKALITWLKEYSKKENKRKKSFAGFAIMAEILEEENVHLRGNNKIIQCLNKAGVALCDICYPSPDDGHTVIAFKHDSEWIYFWDPYWEKIPKKYKKYVERPDEDKKENHNLRIRKKWLDEDTDERYTFGKKDRFCILLWKKDK